MTQQHLEIIHGGPFALRHDGSGHLANLPAPVHPFALKNNTVTHRRNASMKEIFLCESV